MAALPIKLNQLFYFPKFPMHVFICTNCDVVVLLQQKMNIFSTGLFNDHDNEIFVSAGIEDGRLHY